MSRAKPTAKRKRLSKAVPMAGIAGRVSGDGGRCLRTHGADG